jgi:hypothetical protein
MVTGILMKALITNNIDGFANASISNERIMISIICSSHLGIVIKKH